MIKRCWIHSATFQPMNGQPVWVYHDLAVKDIYGVRHEPGIYKAIFRWNVSVHQDYPFWWEIAITKSMTGGLYGHRLWQPRLDGEMPDPPPAEKPPVMWTDSRVSLPHHNAKVRLREDLNNELKAVSLCVAPGNVPVWKCFEDTGELGESPLLVAHMHWRLEPEEKPKV